MNQLLLTAALAACTFGMQLAEEEHDAPTTTYDVSYDAVAIDEYSGLYSKFEFELEKHGHNSLAYTAYELTTSDGYILTTFHVSANPQVPSKGPVLF